MTGAEYLDHMPLERQAPLPGIGAEPEKTERWLELQRNLREETSRPIALSLRDWALGQRGRVLPRSKMGKAIEHMISLGPV